MVNPFRDIDWQPDRAALRRFGRSLVIGFPVIAAALMLSAHWQSGTWANWPWFVGVVGAVVGIWCWALPALARPIYLVWYGLSAAIGLVVSNVLLIATYLLTITPIGLLLRLFGRDPLHRRFDRAQTSYWENAQPTRDVTRYFSQF